MYIYIGIYEVYIYLRSREPLQRFSQNLVLHIFQTREDDLDRSKPLKRNRVLCLSVKMSEEHNSRKSQEPLKRF